MLRHGRTPAFMTYLTDVLTDFLSSARVIRLIWIILLLTPFSAHAWDMTGHRISAEIAYQSLTPCARSVLHQQVNLLQSRYPFVRYHGDLAAFPDYLKVRGVTIYNEWHYISSAWGEKAAAAMAQAKEPNALWALQRIEKMFRERKLSADERAFFFSFYWHLLADIHQPLHTLSRHDHRFPKGDLGGLRYRVDFPSAKNLHELWDQGIDHYGYPHKDYPLRKQQVKKVAAMLRGKYPPRFFGDAFAQTDYQVWIEKSQKLTQSQVYLTPFAAKPSRAYLEAASQLAQQQITLSGYRMALAFQRAFTKEIARACTLEEWMMPGLHPEAGAAIHLQVNEDYAIVGERRHGIRKEGAKDDE